jgi:hypothetical protein
LDYDTDQFELVAGVLTIQDGLMTPAAHSHVIADVTGLQTDLNNKLATSLKGAVSGLAELDATGKVPAAQLPASGSSLELGETSVTAYQGDRGKTAYDHSLLIGSNPHQSTFAQLLSKPTTLAGYGITDAQASDADLTSIAALVGTSGLLKKTAANTWALDLNAYITGITKAMIEAVLTGLISSHTHDYAALNATLNTKTSTYTLVAADNNKILECNGTFTVTLPAYMATGFQVTIVNVGTGVITISATATLFSKNSNRKLASQWIGATAYHRGGDYWVLMGDLTA